MFITRTCSQILILMAMHMVLICIIEPSYYLYTLLYMLLLWTICQSNIKHIILLLPRAEHCKHIATQMRSSIIEYSYTIYKNMSVNLITKAPSSSIQISPEIFILSYRYHALLHVFVCIWYVLSPCEMQLTFVFSYLFTDTYQP